MVHTSSSLQLNLLRGTTPILSVPIRSDRLLIGRGRRCDIRIPDRRISRVQVELWRRGSRWACRNRGRMPVDVLNAGPDDAIEGHSRIQFGPYALTLTDAPRSDRTREWSPPQSHDDAPLGGMIGHSRAMKRTFRLLRRISTSDHPALVVGETGTGKELAARALHAEGPRACGPFVPVNCAAITDALFESELFGHVRGSFTGATTDRQGAFQQAEGGVLFLDEVGELKLEMQAKLLRALESNEVRPVGGRPERVDVRIVAATNRDLARMVAEGTFREDLFFRLSILEATLPPLREREGDALAIAMHIAQAEDPQAVLTPSAEALILQHPWPGNVRELRNAVQRAICLHGSSIEAHALSVGARQSQAGRPDVHARTVERETLKTALTAAGGNRTHAARALGLPRSTLLHRLKRNGLSHWHPAVESA